MATEQSITELNNRSGTYDRQQILIWQRMSPVERLAVADQASHFALEAVRLTVRQPDLSEDEFNWPDLHLTTE